MKKITNSTLFLTLTFLLVLSFRAQAVTHTIQVTNFSFAPQNLTNVQLGDVIRWVYVSGLHTTTSAVIPAGAATWDHNNYGGSTLFEYTPTVAGIYNYVCSPHVSLGMIGSFTVLSPGPTGNTLSGFFRYYNLQNSGIPNASIQLKNGNNEVVATTTSMAGGAYTFTGIPDGSYTLHAIPAQTLTGVNSFDALLALRHFVGLNILTGVYFEVADVTNNGTVNSLDALVISRRFTGIVTSFASGDWYVEPASVNLSGNATFNATFKACFYGDVNGSYNPN